MLVQREQVDLDRRAFKLEVPPKLLIKAFELAKQSEYHSYKLGAIISEKQKGPVICYGINKNKSSPMQDKYSPIYPLGDSFIKSKSIHAEIDAISKMVKKGLHGNHIFVARVTQLGNWANSRPCSGCYKAISDNGIKYMHYYLNGSFYSEFVG